jgi:type IV secretory pathway VirJ component
VLQSNLTNPDVMAMRAALLLPFRALLLATFAVAPSIATAQPPNADLRDLPLVEVAPPARTGVARTAAENTLVVMLTGDGDWAEIDRGIAAALHGAGMGVVGLKARAYLQGAERTPDGTARDVERIARHYGAAWNEPRLVLLGYSRGAGMAPFVATRLTTDVHQRLALVAMFGLGNAASFHFFWSDIVSDRARPTDLPVAPELARLRGTRMLCVYGSDEKDSGCRDADSTLVRRVERAGAHHFDKDYAALGALVLQSLATP